MTWLSRSGSIKVAEYRYSLRGEIDLASAPQLRADLARAVASDGARLLIDCTELTLIDSTAIAVLLEANQKLEADGRRMLIVNVPHGPRRVLETLGLTDLVSEDGQMR
jgi:anti-anti-sigma factor